MPLSIEQNPSAAEVLMELRSMMEAEFGLSPDEIQPDVHLIDDLDLDSIDLVDLAVSLEERSSVKLEEEELKSVRTVADAVRVIHEAFRRRSEAA
ncbi:MAG: acyl carrier protein [Myxococcota bacterium]